MLFTPTATALTCIVDTVGALATGLASSSSTNDTVGVRSPANCCNNYNGSVAVRDIVSKKGETRMKQQEIRSTPVELVCKQHYKYS